MQFGFAVLLALGAAQGVPAAADGESAVRATVGLYLQGQATGNADYYRQSFHPDALLNGVRDGKPEKRTLAEYLAMQSGRPAADEQLRKRSVTNVTVSGDAATAIIILDYPRALTTDHMSLIRSDGQWRIIHKLYNVTSKPTQ